MNRRRHKPSRVYQGFIAAGAVSFFAMLALGVYLLVGQPHPQQLQPQPKSTVAKPPSTQLMGWNEQATKTEEAAKLRASLPKFQIGPKGNAIPKGQKAYLWYFGQDLLGKNIPTWYQEIGDCVSMGAANACDYLQAVQISLGNAHEFHGAFPPYIYGYSRVQIGGGQLGRGDGSTGIWGAKAMQEGGILAKDTHGCPPYSGAVAKEWGYKGPPKEFIEIAKKYPIQTFSQVNNYNDVYEAIVNGYPVSIASNVGFEGGSFEKDGKVFLKRGGSWGHQMCVIGVDDTGSEPAAYIINSWGTRWVVPPKNGEPEGGFWVLAKDIDAICRQDDSFAYSSFVGFPSQEIDWNTVGSIFEKERFHERTFEWVVVAHHDYLLTAMFCHSPLARGTDRVGTDILRYRGSTEGFLHGLRYGGSDLLRVNAVVDPDVIERIRSGVPHCPTSGTRRLRASGYVTGI